jgi:hypothetical protein
MLGRSTEWNGIEQRHGLFGLVGLQRSDQMQRNSGTGRHQRRPFRLGFLHAVFAEHALAGIDDRRNGCGVERFRHCDQRHRRALAARFLARTRDVLLHLGQTVW